jgi:hypothetical protein
VWWSGLTTADARLGLELVGNGLEREVVEGKPYWFDPEAGAAPAALGRVRTVAHLLPNFDEYTVGYRDRAAALHPDRPFDPTFFSFGSILANVVLIGGLVRGSWRRLVGRDTVRVEVRLLDKLSAAERRRGDCWPESRAPPRASAPAGLGVGPAARLGWT